MIPAKSLLLSAALCAADPFNISVAGVDPSSGAALTQRVWYGDGQAYVGPKALSLVRSAFDISSPGTRDQILYVSPDASSSSPSPDQTTYYLAINPDPKAADPVYFAQGPAPPLTTTTTTVYKWVAYSGYLLPLAEGGDLLRAPLGGGAYLVPVAVPGVVGRKRADAADTTYSVRWIQDAGLAARMGGFKVLLSSLPVYVVASSSPSA